MVLVIKEFINQVEIMILETNFKKMYKLHYIMTCQDKRNK